MAGRGLRIVLVQGEDRAGCRREHAELAAQWVQCGTTSVTPQIVGVVAVVAVHFIALLLLLVSLQSVVPIFAELFEERNVKLPAMTQRLLQWSSFAISYWFLIVGVAMLADSGIVALLSLSCKQKWLLPVYSHLWLLGVIILLFCGSIGICLPVAGLLDLSH